MLNNLTKSLLFCTTLTFSSILPADITVTGHGEVKTAPDLANFNVNIETTALTAKEAAELNANQSNKTMDLLKQIVPEDQGVTTAYYSIYPEYNFNNTTNTNEFKGFKAVNSIQVKTKDIKNLGTTLDKVIASGITMISGLNFSYENSEKLYQQALNKAYVNSNDRAQILAKASNTVLKGVKSISITSADVIQPKFMGMAARNVMESTPIEAPDVSTSATIEVVFKT